MATKAPLPVTGEVIGRSRAYVVGGIAGTADHARLGSFELETEEEVVRFINQYKVVFEDEVRQLVKESIENRGL